MTSRLLLVEPSTTMRFVLDNYLQSLGHTVVSVGDFNDAVEALRDQFQSFDSDFDAVILGWPSIAVREADTLTGLLEQDDFHTLPVVVMSTDQRAETRAWVADRPNSAMLVWKSYESIGEVLDGMIQSSDSSQGSAKGSGSTNSDEQSRAPLKFDNSDIGVLLIDDSPSIRESLTNVLSLHGYRINAVASRNEALEVLTKSPIDIAIVDFYLQDETGDEVVRDVMNEAPGTVCAILTSAYSDPIIKLSLRAGAVDCFFKNEAGELLLARIDALARVVRQRKALAVEQQRLDRLVDTLAGATILIDGEDQVTYVSDQAALQLGFRDRRELTGQSIAALSDPEKIRAAGAGRHQSKWVTADQQTLDVVYRLISIPGTSERMLNFKHASAANTMKQVPMSAVAAGGVSVGTATSENQNSQPHTDEKRTSSIEGAADPFLRQLVEYLESPKLESEPVSVLVVGVKFRHNDGTIVPVSEYPDLTEVVTKSLQNIYQRENHVAQLSRHRYGFLLRHTDLPQSYLLTRKIMQMCNDTNLPAWLEGEGQLCVNGCLVGLAENNELPAHDLLNRALSGLRAVDVRGENLALLLDLKRMLPVYPAA